MALSGGGVFSPHGGFAGDDGLFPDVGTPAGGSAGGGSFEVEPAAIRAGSEPLDNASSASGAYGHSMAVELSEAGCAAGVGPLAAELGGLGASLDGAAGELAASLSAAGATLAANAEAYALSDRPLAGGS